MFEDLKESTHAAQLLLVIKGRALAGGGPIVGYPSAAGMIGWEGVVGIDVAQVCSRLDYACFIAGLPMLSIQWVRREDGTMNDQAMQGHWLSFKKEINAVAAAHRWTNNDFDCVMSALCELPNVTARQLWDSVVSQPYHSGRSFIRQTLHRYIRQVRFD